MAEGRALGSRGEIGTRGCRLVEVSAVVGYYKQTPAGQRMSRTDVAFGVAERSQKRVFGFTCLVCRGGELAISDKTIDHVSRWTIMVAANVKGYAFKGRQCLGPNGFLLLSYARNTFFFVAYIP